MSHAALVQSLVSPAAVRRMPFRLPFRRRPASVRGLTVAELLDAAARHPASARVIWAVVGLIPMPDETTADDQKALFELVRLAVGAHTPVAVVRLLRLSEDDLTALLRAIVELTMPAETDALLGKVERRERPDDIVDLGEDDHDTDPAALLARIALVLTERGFGDAMAWTPGRLLFVQSVLGEEDHKRMKRDLIVAGYGSRLGQATDKAYKAAMTDLQNGD